MVIIKVYEKESQEPLKESYDYYIKKYGKHFNEKLCKFAISKIVKYSEAVQPIEKEIVDKLLEAYNITMNNNELWDYVYIANMGKADLYGSSIADELHLAKYIKDVIDDEDGYEGIVFNRWLSDMCGKHIEINWEEMC